MEILITIPHCSNFVPEELRNDYSITPERMNANIDYGTEKIFEFNEFPCLKAQVSRFVVDLNRRRDELYEGQGVIITQAWTGENVLKEKLSKERIEERLSKYYDPFYEKLDSFLKKTPLFVLDGHSMDSKGGSASQDAGIERPDICLATGNGTISDNLLSLFENAFKEAGYRVERNNPYSGKRAKIIHCTSSHEGVQALELEINKRVYMDEETLALKEAEIAKLREVIAKVLNRIKAI